MAGQLTDLQLRVLALLAPVRPRWTLTGGAALAGFHLRHRPTRDLDLFWIGCQKLDREPEECAQLLQADGLEVSMLQRSPGFARLQASVAGAQLVVDLVAEPVPNIEPPVEADAGGRSIQLDTRHEILVNKLGAMLHRAELRDLIDLQALLADGGDLQRALADANRKDGGFSALMLGYLLQGFPLQRQAAVASLPAEQVAALDRFRSELAQRLARLAAD